MAIWYLKCLNIYKNRKYFFQIQDWVLLQQSVAVTTVTLLNLFNVASSVFSCRESQLYFIFGVVNIQNGFLFLFKQTYHLMGLHCVGQLGEISPELAMQMSSMSVLDQYFLAKLFPSPLPPHLFFCPLLAVSVHHAL